MDRLELRTKFASRIEKFTLADFDNIEVSLRPLSALERARIIDKYRILEKEKDSDNALETMTRETQCYIVARGLVDEKGVRIYGDDEADKLAEEIPAKALDSISSRILQISGMAGKDVEATIKNSNPTENGSSLTDLRPSSVGVM